MNKAVHIHTVHYAHICIIESGRPGDDELREELEHQAQEIIAEHAVESADSIASVEEDPEFCCNALTEIGLRGSSLEAVTRAAQAIAEWADNHPGLKLIPHDI